MEALRSVGNRVAQNGFVALLVGGLAFAILSLMLPSLMNAVPDFVWYVVLAVVALVFVAGVVLLGVAKVMRLSATRFLGRV